MTIDEWIPLCGMIRKAFRSGKEPFDDDAAEVYFEFLASYPAEAVKTALHALAQSGQAFVPAVGEITAKVNALMVPVVPSWTVVWHGIQVALKKRDKAVALEWLAEHVHPWVAAFVALEGYDRLRMTPFLDEEYGLLRVKELEGRWAEFAERAAARQAQGLAIETRERREIGPAKVDVAGLLESLGAKPALKQLPQEAGDA